MIDPTYVLALMLAAQPESPHRATYETTAAAIALASTRRPLSLGAEKTAALIVSIAWFESGGTFQPDAEGDRPCLERTEETCTRRGEPRSFCTMQVHRSNFRGLGISRERIQRDIGVCIEAGLTMMHASFSACRTHPLEERLDAYAVGGAGCTHPWRDEGGHRVRKGLALFASARVVKPF
jgi:hypothetical protein